MAGCHYLFCADSNPFWSKQIGTYIRDLCLNQVLGNDLFVTFFVLSHCNSSSDISYPAYRYHHTVAELVQLKDKEIMAMNGMGKAAIKDIRKKQSAYIKELLIELVINEITESSTREVVNVLEEPV